MKNIKEVLIGKPRDIHDPKLFHKISLIAFMAWVGLGADGLSSSAYGPDEAFRSLLQHPEMAVLLALATAMTVFIISYAYSRIIEHFPSGGGGYVVATKLLGPSFGVVSGCALLVDYILTITVSIASGADQIFSFLPMVWLSWKVPVEAIAILLLVVLNLRGVKESITVLVPIFLLFLCTHITVLITALINHVQDIPHIAAVTSLNLHHDVSTLGMLGMFFIFARAYSRGAGTYTGIEAVSNGIQMMREPRVPTAKRTYGLFGSFAGHYGRIDSFTVFIARCHGGTGKNSQCSDDREIEYRPLVYRADPDIGSRTFICCSPDGFSGRPARDGKHGE